MDFDLTEEQRLVRDTAREFAAREVAPKAAEIDKSGRWPAEIVAKMGELGFLGVAIPEEYGGAGLDALTYALVMEEISAACASSGVIMSVNNSLFCDPLYKFGTDAQKAEILTPCASGKKLGCFGLTEPMSGSDAQTMVTQAEKTADGWVLSGAKNWITNGPHADYIVVFAVTDRSGGKVRHTAFVVPKGTPGFTQASPDHKLGIHGAHSCTMFFENCEVPDTAVLGNVGEGFKVAMATLDGGRIGIASQALGIARAALETSVRYSKERKSFGVTISNHQAIQFMLADMATELDAARLLVCRAAWEKDQPQGDAARARGDGVSVAMAKMYATEAAQRIIDRGVQLFGGLGVTEGNVLDRLYREIRPLRIYEGTTEIQKLIIGGALTAQPR